jgi:uncharacterized protein (DUF2267 family)
VPGEGAAAPSAPFGDAEGSVAEGERPGLRALLSDAQAGTARRMDEQQFLALVAREAGVDPTVAERATRAVLTTLSERLSTGEARSLADMLPEPLRYWVDKSSPRQLLTVRDFLQRAAEREGVDEQTAEAHARAVLYALSRALTADEMYDVVSELPKDYRPLYERGYHPPGQVLSIEQWLSRVADRAGVDREAARRVSEAVLEVLAERIAGGEVDDLRKEVPPELAAALLRGTSHTHGVAHRMSLEEFVRRIAQLEGVSEAEARRHARAVLSTLRDSVTQKEFRDLASELPRAYVEQLAHA